MNYLCLIIIAGVKKEYVIGGCAPVEVQLAFRIVRVMNGDPLHCLMKQHPEKRTMQLVHYIKQDYERLFDAPLHISDASLFIEIWAHVYAERLTRAIARFLNWRPVWKLYEFVKGRCDMIDCGEAALDNNRWIWDVLSKLKRLFFFFLKKLP